MNPWLAILLVLVLLAALMMGAGLCAAKGLCSGETSRKTVHLLMGFMMLGFPWIFDEIWPVWTLAGLALLTLAGIRFLRPADAPERRALHGVARESYGEFCFPLAVAIVFTLSPGPSVSYLLSVAALTMADTAGALVGRRFGRHAYTTDEGTKTLEGSLAVLLVTSALSILLLGLDGSFRAAEVVLIALLVGMLTMLVEAVALRGFDNLFIPLLVWILVERYTQLDTEALFLRLLALAMIAAVLLWWRTGTRLNDAGVIGSALLFYMAWFMAGWIWVVPPLLAAVAYARLNRTPGSPQSHTLGAASAVLLPGFFWLILHISRPGTGDFLCYLLAFACSVGLMAVAEWNDVPRPLWLRMAGEATLGAVSGLPGLLAAGGFRPAITAVAGLWIVCLAATLAFQILEWRKPRDHGRDARWLLQGAITLLFSTGGKWL